MTRNQDTNRLADIFRVANDLQSSSTIEEAMHKSLVLVSDILDSQVASIFLLSKNGVLERKAIHGVDVDLSAIADDWFSSESYNVGASFTGKAALSGSGPFGQPYWSENLSAEDLEEASKRIYLEKLGSLQSGVAVPLNDRHRTFGVLEVINKRSENMSRRTNSSFTRDDMDWLSIIGTNVASAIEGLRSRWELRILSEISQILVKPLEEEFVAETLYQRAAEALVNSATPFKACVLRMGQEPDKLKIVARSGDSISWEGRNDDEEKRGEGFARRVFDTGDRIVIERIETRLKNFKNYGWITDNHLRSYACLPVKLGNKVMGTLSVFTGYVHKFDDGDFYLLDNIAFLMATVSDSMRVSEELRVAREELTKDRETNVGSAHEAGYSLAEADLHQYKLILQNLIKQFRQADAMSPGKISRVMNEQAAVIENALTKIDADLNRTERGRVDVNHVIRKVLTYFSKETKGTNLRFLRELGEVPEIDANELEIKDLVLNIVSNGVKAVQKAGRKEGEIRVQSRIVDDRDIEYIEMTFADNGTGIRNEDKERVFVKGYSSYVGGTGMGLFITRRIVDKYGGDIYFTSALGKSTEFVIRLPLKRLRWKD